MKKIFKKFKLNQIQQIKQTYKFIYIYRYNDLTINENIILKKRIKKLDYRYLILKQKLIKNIFPKVQGQGPLLIIFGNNNINLIENLINFKKIELIYLIMDNTLLSHLKLKKIFQKQNIPLNFSIVKPFFNFLYYLRKI